MCSEWTYHKRPWLICSHGTFSIWDQYGNNGYYWLEEPCKCSLKSLMSRVDMVYDGMVCDCIDSGVGHKGMASISIACALKRPLKHYWWRYNKQKRVSSTTLLDEGWYAWTMPPGQVHPRNLISHFDSPLPRSMNVEMGDKGAAFNMASKTNEHDRLVNVPYMP